ncbi:MAG TPA: hypothetical protein VKO45_03050 [Methanomicrobiales archaeon]|nr:hypothetical protein [Methanomicrobiales archaeon]
MHLRVPFLVITLLLSLALLTGCSSPPASQSPGTPVTTPPPSTEPPVTTATVIPTTAPPEPYPGALSIGTPYRYGREDIAMEVTVYRAITMDGYEWWSTAWGKYWNTTPDEGDHFLFAFVRLIDRGTARARLPSRSMFVLHGGDTSYVQNVDRDPSLWIKGVGVRQYDFSYDTSAGWIDPGESNKVEGFLLFEVPATLEPGDAHLEVTFSSQADAVWKLG